MSPAPPFLSGAGLAMAAIYLRYMASARKKLPATPRTAKVFMTNRSQAVRLPKEYQFSTDEVFIRKEGEDVILSPRPRDWSHYLATAPAASPDFMNNVGDLPMQERQP